MNICCDNEGSEKIISLCRWDFRLKRESFDNLIITRFGFRPHFRHWGHEPNLCFAVATAQMSRAKGKEKTHSCVLIDPSLGFVMEQRLLMFSHSPRL
ncbi:hypothetical protein TNCT_214991 [Trichonephila clavata]|uniref:Uncharacterized protein n=1 Tax=Trichonephila clavata TaxID=2740835 RepID=A0A8X6EY67_TRICU|nr:hypothetical protein TNCT_214991 [Trichonephila clavata]